MDENDISRIRTSYSENRCNQKKEKVIIMGDRSKGK